MSPRNPRMGRETGRRARRLAFSPPSRVIAPISRSLALASRVFLLALPPAFALALSAVLAPAAPRAAASEAAAPADIDSVRPFAGDEWGPCEFARARPPVVPPSPCGGEIPCPCGGLVVEDYALIEDLRGCNGTGLVVGADSIVIDLGGRTIEGIWIGEGISISGRRGVVIRNGVIRGFRIGVLAAHANALRIENTRFEENLNSAAWVTGSDGVVIAGNRMEANGEFGTGFRIGAVATLESTTACSVVGNTAQHNGNEGDYVGGIVLYESSHAKISDNVLTDTGEDNVWIRFGGGFNEISGNTITGSGMDGIWIRESNDNIVEGNTIADIDLYAVYVRSAARNRIDRNRIERSGRSAYGGIGIGGNDEPSAENSVSENEVFSSTLGISVHEHAHDNLFTGNVLVGDRTGILAGYGLFGRPNEVRTTRVAGSMLNDVRMDGQLSTLLLTSSEFDRSRVELHCYGIECRIVVRWKVELRVEDETGAPIAGADLILRDNAGASVFAGPTGEDGTAGPFFATDYVLDEHGEHDFNDHLLSVVKEGFVPKTRLLPITADLAETIVRVRETPTGVTGSNPVRPALTLGVFPNPAGGEARIRFSVPSACRVRLDLYDVSGRLVARLLDEEIGGEMRDFSWGEIRAGGATLRPGTYFARLAAGDESIARKIVYTGR